MSDKSETRRLRRVKRSRNGTQRTKRVTVVLTESEHAMLRERAVNEGCAMTRVMWNATFNPTGAGDIDVSHLSEIVTHLRDMQRDLEGATTNLNQVAHHANSMRDVPSDFAAVVEHVEDLADRLDDLLDTVVAS